VTTQTTSPGAVNRIRAKRLILSLASLAVLFLSLLPPAVASHDKSFWLALRAKAFHLPQSESVLPLAREATVMLGSTDPEVRDSVAYEALAAWIFTDRRLDARDLNRLLDVLVTNARHGLGDAQGDGLFLRSFSTLVLSVVAAQDLRQPFLSQRQFEALLNLGIEQLARERDLRGYIVGKGWGHATAHSADLLKFLGRSSRLNTAQQARLVESISGRLRSAGQVFVWGKDARLAAALATLAGRPDVDATPFTTWITRLTGQHAAVWRGSFDPMRYIAVRAQLNTVSALVADLDIEPVSTNLKNIRAQLRSLLAATQ
jgi:Protein of unknown function (DUF2785)